MKTLFASFIALITLAWGWELFSPDHLTAASLPWALRQEGLNLSGLWAIALMSLAMVLATRPVWLERPLGGMDRIYRLHKWAGILAIGVAALHWLVEMSDDVLKALVGRGGRLREHELSAFGEPVLDVAEELGEWAIYALLAMLALTLWKRFPYRNWRWLHRAMPVLYLSVAFHAAVLAPASYWGQPLGWLLAALLAGGSGAALLSLGGYIGHRRRVPGRIIALTTPAPDIVEVSCRLDAPWRGHRAGQFAFVTFDRGEGAHPFTIASADRGDRTVTFEIKGLGDYTGGLARRLSVGMAVTVEGPYGRFDFTRGDPRARQIWVGAGIGITPFLAWLDALQGDAASQVVADLHYCTRDGESDPFVPRLRALCEALPQVHLQIHDHRNGRLTAEALAATSGGARRAEVWFCGPQPLAEALREGLRRLLPGGVRFHQEAFEMR